MILGNDSSASDDDGKLERLELQNRILALDLWITHLALVTGMPPWAAACLSCGGMHSSA
jgi:hypothetical protein